MAPSSSSDRLDSLTNEWTSQRVSPHRNLLSASSATTVMSLPTKVKPSSAVSNENRMHTFSEAVNALYNADPDLTGTVPFRMKDLRRWISCFCALDFNVEIGPEFECIYPALQLSEQDLKTM